MAFCSSCGAPVEGRYCPKCGTAVDSAAPPEGPGPPLSAPGLRENMAAALCYIPFFVAPIIFLVLEPYSRNKLIRFHAFQSIFFNVAWIAFWIVWMIFSAVLTPLTAGVFGLIALPLMLLFILAGFGLWIFLMYQAYQQKLFRLPVVGKFAAEHAGVRL